VRPLQVQQAINQHRINRVNRESGQGTKQPIDMLTLLLDSAEDGGRSSGGDAEQDDRDDAPHRLDPPRRIHYLLSDEEIVANAWVFLLGGFETTANTLTYCCYLLAKHPHIQERVYQEIAHHTRVINHLPCCH